MRRSRSVSAFVCGIGAAVFVASPAAVAGVTLPMDSEMVHWDYNFATGQWTQLSSRPGFRTGESGPTVYRNIRTSGAGLAFNRGNAPQGTNVVMGENLKMVQGGLVSDIWFSGVNLNGAGGTAPANTPTGAIAVTVGFWADTSDPAGTVPPDLDSPNRDPILGGVNLLLPALNSLQGGTFSLTGLKNLGIVVPENVWIAVQFRDNPADFQDFSLAASNYGQVVANQLPDIGESQDNFFRDPFDGLDNPMIQQFTPPVISNFNYLVAVAIPAPGAGWLVAVGALAAARRRRGQA